MNGVSHNNMRSKYFQYLEVLFGDSTPPWFGENFNSSQTSCPLVDYINYKFRRCFFFQLEIRSIAIFHTKSGIKREPVTVTSTNSVVQLTV